MVCKWCSKKQTNPYNHKRHIGLMHAEKANEKELELARKSRNLKFVICDKCGTSKRSNLMAYHLR